MSEREAGPIQSDAAARRQRSEELYRRKTAAARRPLAGSLAGSALVRRVRAQCTRSDPRQMSRARTVHGGPSAGRHALVSTCGSQARVPLEGCRVALTRRVRLWIALERAHASAPRLA